MTTRDNSTARSNPATRVTRRRLQVAKALHDFINDEVLPGTGVPELEFWAGFDRLLHNLAPENRSLLAKRDRLQAAIDTWHRDHAFAPFDAAAYREFLAAIGYLGPDVADFTIATGPLDPEMSTIAGPQLVVPLTNARYALNAANARWGSLYDAVYGTDMIPGAVRKAYDPVRGAQVIGFARTFLDQAVPLAEGSYMNAGACRVTNGELVIAFDGGRTTGLRDPSQFAGYTGEANAPAAILFVNHGLHIEIRFDRSHPVGASDPAGICDVVLEAATTSIMDLEDSVATVDAEDKVAAYRNWLGLMTGTLTAEFDKSGRTLTRRLAVDRSYTGPDGAAVVLRGTALMLVRNVGHMPLTDAILLDDGSPAPEGIVDAMITAAIGIHGIKSSDGRANSRTGSIYVVKPKLHGPEEVAFADKIFDQVEEVLGLAPHTIKMGLMDEERRTSVNLKACIRAASHRIAFINTGFLDRTGDEIHTSFEAGPMVPKNEMKNTGWIKAYEERNVIIGLACGFKGRAQIGKGMWAKPDRMADLYKEKIAQVRSGANTAWVPSPTAAVLHALHYHEADVAAHQAEMALRACPPVEALLEIPVIGGQKPTEWEIQAELENNIQGVLGYVVRWIDQGIGCSKVPDINNVGLMEDRATLRISSQHVANWIRHGLCRHEQVVATLQEMARVVDEQNEGDAAYYAMAENWDGNLAFRAASALIFEAFKQPNGYTELILNRFRLQVKHRAQEPAIKAVA